MHIKFKFSVVKRSADLTSDGKYAEFSGKIIEYNIMNIDKLSRK